MPSDTHNKVRLKTRVLFLSPVRCLKFVMCSLMNLIFKIRCCIVGLNEKHVTANSINGVVGQTGKKTPIAPSASKTKPDIVNKIALIFLSLGF